MRNDFRISKSPKDGNIIITTSTKNSGKQLSDFFLKIDDWVSKFGEGYKVVEFYTTPKKARCLDFLTNIPYSLYFD